MKTFLLTSFLSFSSFILNAQVTWDGGGGDGLWDNPANWATNTVPLWSENVVLDNSLVAGNYTVYLSGGNNNYTINKLAITPGAGKSIRLIVPSTNVATSAITMVQGTGDVITIGDGGVLEISSGGAYPGNAFSMGTSAKTRINNGGRYIHNSATSASVIVASLSTAAGTELGVFEYAQNATAPVLSDAVTYGSVELTTTGTKTYTTSGAMDVTIRGYLKINSGVSFNSTKIGDFRIAGDLTINGNFDLSPSSATDTRQIVFNGTSNQTISGLGNFTLNANFDDIEINPGATVTLQRGITLANATSDFNVNNGATLQMGQYVVGGTGRFFVLTGGWLGIGSPGGITTSGASGNVQTTLRSFASNATYEYNGGVGVTQVAGDGLPSTVAGRLKINSKAGLGTTGVTLSTTMMVSGEFNLAEGKLTTTTANKLFLGASSTTITPYSDIAFVSGPMVKYGNTDYTYPVGKGVMIHTIGMKFTSGGQATDFYTIEYFNSYPSIGAIPQVLTGGIHHISSLEYWGATVSVGASAPTAQIILQATGYSNATDRSRLVVARTSYGTGVWLNMGNADLSTTGAVGSVSSLPSIGFATEGFTLASLDPAPINPLPVDLISFDASKLSNTKSSISWELAACCSAAAKFEIQKAGAEKHFVTVGTISGSETNKLYNYIDNGLKNGINYYRLKMMDENGKNTYSRIVAVMNGVNGLLLTSLIPTMVSNTATLTVASSGQRKLDLIIVDMQGRMMLRRNYTIAAGNTSIELQLTGLVAGAYQLTGISAESKTTIRFIKQ
jgi:hypothetical protein